MTEDDLSAELWAQQQAVSKWRDPVRGVLLAGLPILAIGLFVLLFPGIAGADAGTCGGG